MPKRKATESSQARRQSKRVQDRKDEAEIKFEVRGRWDSEGFFISKKEIQEYVKDVEWQGHHQGQVFYFTNGDLYVKRTHARHTRAGNFSSSELWTPDQHTLVQLPVYARRRFHLFLIL